MKTAIVTGAAGNMGRAIVTKLLNSGYRVIGTTSRHDVVPIDIAHEHFEKKEIDLLSEKEVTAFVASIISSYEKIDVAILTVGGFASGDIANTDGAAITRQIELNFLTAYHVARPVFLQMMQQPYGRIFLIGSKPGLDVAYGNGMVAYGLGKSLLFRLAELMNEEAKGNNIVTSVVVPGTIDTAQNRKAMPHVNPQNWVTTEAIANILHYHCSDEANALRETVIKIYGNSWA